MVSDPEYEDRGYDPNRFVFQVRRDLLCYICHCVLKDPRLCEAEEHYFCLNCITRYLDTQSPICPACNEHLTPQTLQHSDRLLRKVLSEQRIKCDYINRGCFEQVYLGSLKDHVDGCKYRPIPCKNCGLHVNAKDLDNHQQNFCLLKEKSSTMRATQNELSKKRNKKERTKNTSERNLEEIMNNVVLQSNVLDKVVSRCNNMDTAAKTFRDKVESDVTKIKIRRDELYEKVKTMKVIKER